MSPQEFFDRLRERLRELFHSEKRSIRLASRLVALSCAGIIVATIAPTLADELSSSPEMIEPTPLPTPAPTESPSPEPSSSLSADATTSATPEPIIVRPSIALNSPTPATEVSDSPTVKFEPPAPLEVQPRYTLRIPSTQPVDPRAKSFLLPHIYAQTDDPAVITLVCISGSGLYFDALQKKSQQTMLEGPDYIAGDRSGQVLIAGPSARVQNIINSYTGLVAYSDSVGIAGRSIYFQFVALNKPALDPTFCSAARSLASLTLRPLGLSQSTVKGGGALK